MRHDIPLQLATPPPAGFTLEDERRQVGWVSDDQVVFTGFADESEAANAAWVAHRALMHHIVRSFGSRSAPLEAERVLVAQDEEGVTVRADGRPIARLLHPGSDPRIEAGELAFALRLPRPLEAQAMRATAWMLYRSLRASGARWGIFPSVTASTTGPAPARQPIGLGMRLGMIAILVVMVAVVQPMLAPDTAIRAPLLVIAAAAFGAAGVSELLRRAHPPA